MRKAGGSLSQVGSIPASNSHSFPGCLDPKEAKTVAPKERKPEWQSDDWERPDLNDAWASTSKHRYGPNALVQMESIPACNSEEFPKC